MEAQKGMSDGGQISRDTWKGWVLDALSDGRRHSGREVHDMLCPDPDDLSAGLSIVGVLNDMCIDGTVERDVAETRSTYRLHRTPPHPLQTQMTLACCKRDAEAFAERDEYAKREDVKAELLEASELIGKAMKHLNYASYLKYQHECEDAVGEDGGGDLR